jgi:hypothetical protein
MALGKEEYYIIEYVKKMICCIFYLRRLIFVYSIAGLCFNDSGVYGLLKKSMKCLVMEK